MSHSSDKLNIPSTQRLVRVFVEGYEDVAFWRGIFDYFTNPDCRFEISVPTRSDLPKGKKILLGMVEESSEDLIMCVDSDFDYLFGGATEQSRRVNESEFMFHTYTYATENYLCYAPSLHNVCVKATKNDTRIFSFESFLSGYSEAIYSAFLWYAFSAQMSSEHVFTLPDFKATVRIGYLDIADSGAATIEWVRRNVNRRVAALQESYPQMAEQMAEFQSMIESRGVTPQTTYLYMHGHALMDSVVMVCLSTVCEKLRQMSISRIMNSSKRGVALKNEMSNYNNSLRSIKDVLLDNQNYITCPLYMRLHGDIARYIERLRRQD